MNANAVKLKAFGESLINRWWKIVLIVLMTGVLAAGFLAYSNRHTIIVWHLQENNEKQEMVIIEMLRQAKPIIERELNMTLPEIIYSRATGNRSEKDRRTDALEDVRTFIELGFKNNWLRFKDVHNLSSVNDFPLNGFEFALVWKGGAMEEVLVAFNISCLKGKVDKMKVNDNCGFFKELKSYVTTKAKKSGFFIFQPK